MTSAGRTVSVVIPCHNAARFVGETLECVLAQTWPEIEVIAVDDHSSDGTRAIIDSFAARGVVGLAASGRGAARARNLGLRASRGAYVLFLDADDIIEPGHVASLIDALDGSQRHLAMGQWDRFRENIAEATFPARTNYRSAGPADWLSADWVGGAPMAQCGQFLIPRALLDQAGGWDEELSLIDDLEFFARLICASEGIRFTPHAKLYYRTGIAGSLSGQTSRKAAESAVRSLLLGTGHLLAVEDSARTRRACANILRTFDHTFYPRYADLRGIVERRVAELGGSDLTPVGPPRFHALRRWIGWRAARRIQHFWERLTA